MKLSEAKNIIVTGGTGFVGSYLVERLLETNDCSIVVIDNNFSYDVLPDEVKAKVRIEIQDIRNLDKIEKIFEETKPEICFHLAAIHFIPYCNKHPNEVVDVNIRGTSNVQFLCNKYQSNIIQTSTAAVYAPDDQPHKENSKIDPPGIYGYSKMVNEHTLSVNLEDNLRELTGVNARLFNVYGRRDLNPHVLPEILQQMKKQTNNDSINLELGNIQPKRDYIHANDVADALISITESDLKGIHTYNIGTGVSWSVEEVINKLEEIINKKIAIEHSQERMRKSERMFHQADIAKILQETSWKPKI
ncbi:MAG: NAD-dependent epimerase/dehydratase family protein, partial [Candidatus Heimdallarchaeaceae archaeon]